MTAETFTIRGQLAAPSFIPWIRRHAARIGIEAEFAATDAEIVALRVSGPSALLDAMEMGCLLGPIDVWIDSIRRDPDPEFSGSLRDGQSARWSSSESAGT